MSHIEHVPLIICRVHVENTLNHTDSASGRASGQLTCSGETRELDDIRERSCRANVRRSDGTTRGQLNLILWTHSHCTSEGVVARVVTDKCGLQIQITCQSVNGTSTLCESLGENRT